jgi:hypothetical protein
MEVEGGEDSYRVTLRLPVERVAAGSREVPNVARG